MRVTVTGYAQGYAWVIMVTRWFTGINLVTIQLPGLAPRVKVIVTKNLNMRKIPKKGSFSMEKDKEEKKKENF